jgi:hypothetical protein
MRYAAVPMQDATALASCERFDFLVPMYHLLGGRKREISTFIRLDERQTAKDDFEPALQRILTRA